MLEMLRSAPLRLELLGMLEVLENRVIRSAPLRLELLGLLEVLDVAKEGDAFVVDYSGGNLDRPSRYRPGRHTPALALAPLSENTKSCRNMCILG